MSDSYFPTDSLNAMNVDVSATDAVSGEDKDVKLGEMLHGYVIADEDNKLKGFTDDSKNLSILTGESLPDYSEANEGDVLQIQSNEPVWGAVDALPEIEETDEGKVLAVDQGEAVWADAPSGLPEITNSDEGKVLTVVDNSGTLEAEWAEPSGGGEMYLVKFVTPITIGDVQRFISDKTDTEIQQHLDNAEIIFATVPAADPQFTSQRYVGVLDGKELADGVYTWYGAFFGGASFEALVINADMAQQAPALSEYIGYLMYTP